MKLKYIVMLVLIPLLIPRFAYSQIKFKGYFETGTLKESYSLNQLTFNRSETPPISENYTIITTNGVEKISYVTRLNNNKCMYSELSLKLSWKWLSIEQNLYDVFTYEGSGFTFKPLEIMYTTRLYWEWKFLRVGYEHMCLHPIINYHNVSETVTRRASHDKLYLRVSFEN